MVTGVAKMTFQSSVLATAPKQIGLMLLQQYGSSIYPQPMNESYLYMKYRNSMHSLYTLFMNIYLSSAIESLLNRP